jgi:hypothetical protein
MNKPFIFAIASVIAATGATGLGQPSIYDSRNEPAPHVFDWNDVYESVSIWDAERFTANGGFIGGLYTGGTATGTITAGQIGGVFAADDSSLLVLGVNTDYISAQGRATVDLYGGLQSDRGQVLAGGDAVIRIFGGSYDRVYSWFEQGRIEVMGTPRIRSLAANADGVVIQKGGEVHEMVAARTGILVLDDGVVLDDAAAIEDSTIVIAGGTPPPKVRLFDHTRLIILHEGDGNPAYLVYGPSDLDQLDGNFAGKDLTISLDGSWREFRVAGWINSDLQPRWSGRIEIVEIRDAISVFSTRGGSIALAFRAPGDEMLQMEFSHDLKNWKPLRDAIPGDWKIHVEVVKRGVDDTGFFRLRKWSKPR